MNFTKKVYVWLLLLLLFIVFPSYSENISQHVSIEEMSNLVAHIEKNIKNWQIPGLSIAIIDGDKTIFRNFGFSDEDSNQIVTENTIFELASNSKSFTALGLLLLCEEGKIALDEPISKYIPWFSASYNNKNAEIKIEDFLYHKSGIPTGRIANIPSNAEADAIEKVVRDLVGISLDFKPGSKFSYSTINYDVLGLVIETVSGISYEKYIKEEILIPLGLENTYTNLEAAASTGNVAQGFKMNLLKARPYCAPYYRGNVPAGYIYSTSQDCARWLQLQLGLVETPEPYNKIIEKSHIPDLSQIDPFRHTSYASGWFYNPDRIELQYTHNGNNPNFSTFIAFNPDTKIGVVVLANINSGITNHIGIDILNTIYTSDIHSNASDMYTRIDIISLIIFLFGLIVSLIFLYLSRRLILDIKKGKRAIQNKKSFFIKLAIASSLIITMCVIVFISPRLFLGGVNWTFVNTWASNLLLPAIIAFFVSLLITTGYLTTVFSYRKYNVNRA